MNRNKIIKIIPYILAIFVFFSLSNVSKLNNTEYFASNTFLNEAEKILLSVNSRYAKREIQNRISYYKMLLDDVKELDF